MKVSVVIPVFNVPDTLLSNCLDSIAKQSLRSDQLEIIVVDDGSTELETIRLVNEFVSNIPTAILVRHEENKGLNEARISGLAAATGDYVMFVDGDDMLTRDGAESLLMEAVNHKADIVTSGFWRWNNETKKYANLQITSKELPVDHIERLKIVLSCQYSFTMCGRLFRKSILTPDIFAMDRGQLHEDVITFPRVLLNAGRTAHCAKNIYYYTFNPSSITGSFSKKNVDGLFKAIDDWILKLSNHGILEELLPSISQGAEKLINTSIDRCVISNSLTLSEKEMLVRYIKKKYFSHNFSTEKQPLEGIELIAELSEHEDKNNEDLMLNYIGQKLTDGRFMHAQAGLDFRFGIGPSEMAHRLKDKIVFIGQVDYQVRNAAAFSRELRLNGHPCVVLDNSSFAAGGARRFKKEDSKLFYRTEHIQIDTPPYGMDWLSTAKLVIVFNDFNEDFREALEFRNRLGMPSVCMVEGINDFLRIDFETPRYLPYRRCDYVFLAGQDDERYFKDRETFLVGLPIIEKLAEKTPQFPEKPLAVLNVNFTYGAHENKRREFVCLAEAAFEKAGVDWVITQHPMDKGNLSSFPKSNDTQYELIDQCSVFVSRFATGILEALASGKPVVYFNPHGEKVAKYTESLGAFEIATNVDELSNAIRNAVRDIENGVDFRERAQKFLEHHTAFRLNGLASTDRFYRAVLDVIKRSEYGVNNYDLFFNALNSRTKFKIKAPGVIFGEFGRQHKAQLNEEELIGRYFGDNGSLMLDVGANFGNSLDIYLGKGWAVHAFEPDPNNREKLKEIWPSCPQLTINDDAVSDKEGEIVPFYASPESTGISGLSAFTKGHEKITEVKTTTLRKYYKEANLKHVDFLKIDVEGFDKFVLDGFPWEVDKPDILLAEFEDSKTVPLGYTVHDLAQVMIDQGYTVLISKWHPIVRYGIAHDWAGIFEYSKDLNLSSVWGNAIGFKDALDKDRFQQCLLRTIKFAANEDRFTNPLKLGKASFQHQVNLTTVASELILDPSRTLGRLALGSDLYVKVTTALQALDDNNPAKRHFLKAKAYADDSGDEVNWSAIHEADT